MKTVSLLYAFTRCHVDVWWRDKFWEKSSLRQMFLKFQDKFADFATNQELRPFYPPNFDIKIINLEKKWKKRPLFPLFSLIIWSFLKTFLMRRCGHCSFVLLALATIINSSGGPHEVSGSYQIFMRTPMLCHDGVLQLLPNELPVGVTCLSISYSIDLVEVNLSSTRNGIKSKRTLMPWLRLCQYFDRAQCCQNEFFSKRDWLRAKGLSFAIESFAPWLSPLQLRYDRNLEQELTLSSGKTQLQQRATWTLLRLLQLSQHHKCRSFVQ